MTLTRRSFLHISGLAVVAAQVPAQLMPAFANREATLGRVLAPISIADASGHPVRQLWPDTVVRIIDDDARCFRLFEGWVPRSAIQPMSPRPERIPDWPALPCLAEVIGPVAPVRTACSAEAQIVTRIGHGGVLYVVDMMKDENGLPEWLAVGGTPDTFLGWTKPQRWQPACPITPPAAVRELGIDTERRLLHAIEGEAVVATAPVSIADNVLASRTVRVKGRRPAMPWNAGDRIIHGVPWVLELSDAGFLVGAYWHNEFGTPVPGPAVQIAPVFARWLYTWLPDGALVSFR